MRILLGVTSANCLIGAQNDPTSIVINNSEFGSISRTSAVVNESSSSIDFEFTALLGAGFHQGESYGQLRSYMEKAQDESAPFVALRAR